MCFLLPFVSIDQTKIPGGCVTGREQKEVQFVVGYVRHCVYILGEKWVNFYDQTMKCFVTKCVKVTQTTPNSSAVSEQTTKASVWHNFDYMSVFFLSH